ncbi:hypothetical protein DENIS_0040 [Desulfonema ishimotonii]|uniref:Periplasmic chaperone PpiD n=1 Tax=Desulfonema ishimotonii TaxID=45657 RepID=A0A401FQ37_9BACT|nr:peptidylprolyl isomerase [Desulfonema ishimotonii]GBC59109.1 hypothetical protein DENIS_0040 [Desulfonema ishimotonii]
MLKLMRERAGSWFIKVILSAIVIVFVFWGVGSFRSQRFAKVAVVNDEPVSLQDYQKAYNNMIAQYSRQFGNNFDDNMIKMLGVKRQALDSLINDVLLQQEAEKLSFRVSDQELVDVIEKIPAFQTDGVFDKALYQRVLSLNNMTLESFEAMQGETLLMTKVRSFVMDSVKVSDPEARAWYNWKDAAVKIDYVRFDAGKYKDTQASDDEVKAHFEENKGSYKTEARAKALYVHFDAKDYAEKAEVSQEEITEYFESHPDEFKEPKTVEARHILFKLESDSSPETVEKRKEKASEVLALAREGKDFAELAKEYSEGPTRSKGGFLGKFRKETMVKPFADKAFSMKAGEISEPVRTRFGWHLIKVEKVNEAKTFTLAESTEKIRSKIAGEKAKTLAYDDAEAFYDSVFEGDNLKDAAAVRNLKVTETGLFTQKGPEGMKNGPRFAAAAFKLSPTQFSDIQDFDGDYYILQMTGNVPAETAAFETVADKVRADLILKKQNETAESDASRFLEAVRKGAAMADESRNSDVTLQTTDFFKRNVSIPKIGYDRAVSAAAFTLSKENAYPESPVKGKDGYYVIRFNEKKLPDDKAFEKEKKAIKEQLLRQKQFKTFNEWLAQARANSEITIQEDVVN